MKPISVAVAAAGVLGLFLSATVAAQPPGGGVSVSLAPVYQFDSDLDAGGEAGYSALLGAVGRNWALDERTSIGAQLSFAYEDWRFDRPLAFGGVAPWDELYRVGLAVPYVVRTTGGWRLGITPSVQFSGESGADFGDALEYGATASAAKAVRPDLILGVGVGVFQRIEKTSAFPFLVVDWRINEAWRLTNPSAAGPAGPAGLELSTTRAGWEAGIGAAFRSYRHRLADNGLAPDGVAEHRIVPVYLRLGRDFGDGLSLSLYAGAAVGTRLRLENADGHRLVEEDQDPAAMLGLLLSGRF